MKKLFAFLITNCFISLPTVNIIHAENESVSKEFKTELEEKLKNEVNYYNENSVSFEKTLTMDGKIFKLISADDPETEENEEKRKNMIQISQWLSLNMNKKEIHYFILINMIYIIMTMRKMNF